MSDAVTPIPTTDADETPEMPLPPATFEFMILSLKMQIEMHLGLLHFGPQSDAPKINLKHAQHSIDTMAMLLDKTKGNLTLEEKRLLENSLTELRFRYVQAGQSQ